MDSHIQMIESDIFIPAENMEAALDDLYKAGYASEKLHKSLEGFFWFECYHVYCNDKGLYLESYDDKMGYDREIFLTIAPYAHGNSLWCDKDDGSQWKWCFEDGNLVEYYPTITWSLYVIE